MRRIAPRIVPIVGLTLLLAAGCGSAPAVVSDGPADGAEGSTVTVTIEGSSSASTGSTSQGVVLGPAVEPVAADDIAPRLFSDEPAIIEALRVELPIVFATDHEGFALGDHLILVLKVAGAAESEGGVEVYADMWEQWLSLDGWQPVQGTGGVYPVRIRLARDGAAFHIEGVEGPQDGEGYGASLDEMLPKWARDRVDLQESRDEMQDALWVAAADWARPHVPADLFVDQPPAAIPDPHGHQPASSEYRMLAAKYVDCELAEVAAPTSDDYQAEFAYPSEDGRFRLFFPLSGDGVVVKDTQSGEWWSVRAPGRPTIAVSPGTFDPVWHGHTLFIDFATTMDPFEPTQTHYEIDFDSPKVIRAVPLGPLSFNE